MDKNNYKFAFVVNKKIELGKIINAVGHLSASLMAKATEEQRENMLFVDYEDADNNKHLVSGLSLIILKAKNSNQIRTARERAIDAGVLYTDFVETMTEGSYKEQMERTSKLGEGDLNYWGLALFGEVDKVNEITKKFSLYT